MSASLVGSEMCIRDRAPGTEWWADNGKEITWLFLRFQAWDKAAARRREPVSYTHLTLPTICSV
eukprot:275795-Alexandrium_andersonii.AAC.1